MFYDLTRWFRDWDGDLSIVWEWFKELFLFYWSEHPFITMIVAFFSTVMILISNPKTRLFGNQLLSIGVNWIGSTINFFTQTVIKDGGKWLLSMIASSIQNLIRSIKSK